MEFWRKTWAKAASPPFIRSEERAGNKWAVAGTVCLGNVLCRDFSMASGYWTSFTTKFFIKCPLYNRSRSEDHVLWCLVLLIFLRYNAKRLSPHTAFELLLLCGCTDQSAAWRLGLHDTGWSSLLIFHLSVPWSCCEVTDATTSLILKADDSAMYRRRVMRYWLALIGS